MQIPDPIQQAATAAADLVEAYASVVAAGAGAVGALVAIYAFRKFAKKREHDDMAADLGVLLFAVVTTEGMWEVVHNKLGVNTPLTVAMFAAFDVVIYAQGRLAIRKLTKNPQARVGTYLAIIWALSLAASVTVSTAGGNTTTQLFRFFSPLVAAALWTQKVMELRSDDGDRQESNWIWTPTRLMIRWGWMKPGAADDLTDVFRQRAIKQIVDNAVLAFSAQRAQAAGKPLEGRAAARADKAVERLAELAKTADEATIEAARTQLALTLGVRQRLFAGLGPDGGPVRDLAEPDRLALEELRTNVRTITTGLAADHRTMRAVDQAADQTRHHRVVHGVRMPAHIADQIPDQIPDHWVARFRTRPDQIADQASGPDQTTRADQIPDQTEPRDLVHARTNPTTADQTATSGSVPATRTSPAQRTTVRVDRARPVSPAAGGEVPPKVREMAKAIAKRYRGEIPPRSTVMEDMSWTSADYTGKAIKLVRDERAARTQKGN